MTLPDPKKPYVKPALTRISLDETDKFTGARPKYLPCREVDGHPLSRLVEDYGSPLYVVSEETLRRSYREMANAFTERYPRTAVAYSYKTNHLSGICAILHQEGAWAEVVSGFEYDIARRLGVPGERIIFNGPCKRPAEMHRAFVDGAAVNLDSFDELEQAEAVAEKLGRTSRVGVRVNMALNFPAWDKFGFNLEDGQAEEACRRIVRHRYLHLNGLHCHIGTYVIDPGLYRRAVENLLSLAVKIREKLNTPIDAIDIGGGFPSRNTLHSQLMPGETLAPTPDQYAEIICTALTSRCRKLGFSPRLILEPGRSVVDESMVLLSRVVAVKKKRDGKPFIIIDAGVNVLSTAYYYRHDLAADRESSEAGEPTDVFGPLCMQIDVIRWGAPLPPLRPGDIITIRNVGAYNLSQSLQFIFPRPAVILVGGKTVEVLRRAETFEDVKGPEQIPKRLLPTGCSTAKASPR